MKLSKLLFSFSGRITRRQYWVAQVLLYIIYYATFFAFTETAAEKKDISLPLIIVTVMITAILFWFFLAAVVKRLHDFSYPAYWSLYFVAIIFFNLFLVSQEYYSNILSVLYIMAIIMIGVVKATPGTNKYGDEPGIKTSA